MTAEVNSKPSLLILNDHFYPAHKAGGPIQSLNNLVAAIEKKYTISVITSAYDLHSNKSAAAIKANEWNMITLPHCCCPIQIWYEGKSKLDVKKISSLLQQIKPVFIYLNGIFSYRFFILPLVAVKRLKHNSKLIICPRGMLQKGALSVKSSKKIIYLKLLKSSFLLKGVYWHATSAEESGNIKSIFGNNQPVKIAANITRPPVKAVTSPIKQLSRLRLVYLSLIAEKKNLLLTLQIIKNCNNVSLAIYGPVKDFPYWEKCKKIIDSSPEKFSCKGDIMPDKVQETFEQYDASILLTKGENFGHALYESLSAGRPVITSHYTPWNNLRQQKAGWNIAINSGDEAISLLTYLCEMPGDVFDGYCTGAHKLAVNYYSNTNGLHQYTNLFC